MFQEPFHLLSRLLEFLQVHFLNRHLVACEEFLVSICRVSDVVVAFSAVAAVDWPLDVTPRLIRLR